MLLRQLQDPLRASRDGVGRADTLAACRRSEIRSQEPQLLLDLTERFGCASTQCRFEVAQRYGCSGGEADRLLNLEIERDPSVLDAARVLDRHEAEEAPEEIRAARLLAGGERDGAEGAEAGVHARPRGRTAASVCGDERVEVVSKRRGAVLASIARIRRREDLEVAAGERTGCRRLEREAALERLVPGLEGAVEAGLVGAEQVGAHDGCSRARCASAGSEGLERQRRLGACPREARRRPELAHEEPRPRTLDLTPPRGRDRDLGARLEQASPRLCAGEDGSAQVVRDRCASGPLEVGAQRRRRFRRFAVERRRQLLRGSNGTSDPALRLCAFAEEQGSLGRRELGAQCVGGARGLERRRAGRCARCEPRDRGDEHDERASGHRLLLDRDAELGRRLRDLACNGVRTLLRILAEELRLFGREPLPGLLALEQLGDRAAQAHELAADLAAAGTVLACDRGLHALVHHLEAAEDVADVRQARDDVE